MNGPNSWDEVTPSSEVWRVMGRPILVTTDDEREFASAMKAYKNQSGRLFPTWCEILEVLRSLGYAKRIWKPIVAPTTSSEVGATDHDLSIDLDRYITRNWCLPIESSQEP